jgi:hypothetical protein
MIARTPRTRARRARRITAVLGRALGAVVLLGMLAGCITIPTGGGVQSGPILIEDGGDSLIDLPEGPAAGASIADILVGFIRAGRGPQNLYRVAREFLADGVEWSPTERVRITNSALLPVEVDGDTYSVALAISAEVDSSGRYVEQESQQTFSFDFVQEDGEWRISSAPPGTFIPSGSFDRAFSSFPLYFFAPGFDFLVPDLRWFPNTRGAASRIVRELLAGPSPWLGSGVLVSAFPVGTALETSFEPEAGRALVPLSPEVSAEPATAQRRMLQQLTASLLSLGNLQTVVIAVGGLPLSITESGAQPEQLYLVGPGPLGGADSRFGVLRQDGVRPLDAVGTRADSLGAVAAALDRAGTRLAVLGTAGVSLVGESGDPVLIDPRPDLVAPTIDPYGWTWSVPAADPEGLIVIGPDGATALPLPLEGRVVSLELSRDGARLLVGVETPSGPRVLLFGVIRDVDLVPVRLGVPIDLDIAAGDLVDVAWVDDLRVAVLRRGVDSSAVDVFEIGGKTVALDPLVDAVAIVGGNGLDGVRVLDGSGQVLMPSTSGGWADTGLRASFLAAQQ